ncbi:hypothetical protein [Intrasporangium flavum]|uniref:hypothetical protein n=1 Tax=Intrasporangium flavum TaxID=1428657 RepID=UPI00096D555A|nr:hypothetical protein [Intrasporangium flavum]
MVRSQAAVDKALRVAVIVIGVAFAGYIALHVLLFHALQEPYPYLDVQNESGRPLLIERADFAPSPGGADLSVLAWHAMSGWPAGSYECDQSQLVARDVQGSVVARRTGVCQGDTWTITSEGMSAAPRYRPGPAGTDLVEARLVLVTSDSSGPVVVWWRALPQALQQAAATGSAAGVSVHGPFLEGDDLTLYVRGPDAATVLEFARTRVLTPSPGRVDAYITDPGRPAPTSPTPVVLESTTSPPARTR